MADAQHQQATEYTLQGVMRYLQLEWHAHERARNAWDIERAELKAKIAKQEGDCRSSKKINESLMKQIRMLERALKDERTNRVKNKPTESPEMGSVKAASAEASGVDFNHLQAHHPNVFDHNSKQAERESARDNSKEFLQKCVEELSYLLTPPPYPVSAHESLLDQVHEPVADPFTALSSGMMVQNPNLIRRAPPGPPHLPTMPSTRDGSSPFNSESRLNSEVRMAGESQLFVSQTRDEEPVIRIAAIDDPSSGIKTTERLSFGDPDEASVETYEMMGQPLRSGQDFSGSQRESEDQDSSEGWMFPEEPSIGTPDSGSDPSIPLRPDAEMFPITGPVATPTSPRNAPTSRRRRSSGSLNSTHRRRSDEKHEIRDLNAARKAEEIPFRLRFALRGHLDVVRSVIFTGGGSPSEPELCTAGEDGLIKRWIVPGGYGPSQSLPSHNPGDIDIQPYFTHRGHEGIVTSLAACPPASHLATGGRALGDGWIFSGGQDSTIKVWERGRVDPKATIEAHTDVIWALCVLPGTAASILGIPESETPHSISNDRIILVSGSADGTVKVWLVSAPPPPLSSSPSSATGSRRGVGGSRRHSVTSGSGFPASPQPSTASNTPFTQELLHSIQVPNNTEGDSSASPTDICPFGNGGDAFAVSYSNSDIIIFDTRSGEQVVGMASNETYDGTFSTAINAIGVRSADSDTLSNPSGNLLPMTQNPFAKQPSDSVSRLGNEEDATSSISVVHGATGTRNGGLEGVVVSGHEDRYVRFFDANSGQCTYSMLAHPASIGSLCLSPDGQELVTGGHDASIRFWSLEKRTCVQEITSHRLCRGEGVLSVVWSKDGRWVVSAGGDSLVKVFSR